MTIQVIETGELVEPMSEVEAERITSRIADKLDTIADNLEQVMPLIREALTREAWKALGYSGATAYVSARFAKALGRLPRDVRQPVVMELSAAGMSTRAIAPIVGVTHKTVVKDIQVVRGVPPETSSDLHTEMSTALRGAGITPPDTGHYWSPQPDKAVEPASPVPPKVQGLDGKSYPRAEPAKPKRRPITDQARDAGWELRRATEKLQRILEDDRLSRNKEEVAAHIRGHLMFTVEACQGFLDQINN